MARSKNINFVIPRGAAALIAQANKYLVESARKRGLQLTKSYSHNLDRTDRREAMETFPFMRAYAKELGEKETEAPGFLLYTDATHPEEDTQCMVVERIANYRETVHPTGDGDERTEKYSGIVIMRRLSSGPCDRGAVTRLKVVVKLHFNSINNMFNLTGWAHSLSDDEAKNIPFLIEEAA